MWVQFQTQKSFRNHQNFYYQAFEEALEMRQVMGKDLLHPAHWRSPSSCGHLLHRAVIAKSCGPCGKKGMFESTFSPSTSDKYVHLGCISNMIKPSHPCSKAGPSKKTSRSRSSPSKLRHSMVCGHSIGASLAHDTSSS